MEDRNQKQSNLAKLRERLASGRMRSARALVASLHTAELARLLESLPLRERAVVWDMVDSEREGDVLVEVADEVRDGLIEGMGTAQLIAAIDGMELDDLADLVAELPETLTQEVLRSLDQQDRERLHQVMSYDEDSAGGLMNVDIVTVRPDVTVEVVLRYLRVRGGVPDGTDSIFVVNRDNEYRGALLLSRLLTADPERTVSEIMLTDVYPIPAEALSEDVVREFENRDLLSAPVTDRRNCVVGRITVDDVVDVIREEAEHSLMGAAGLDEEDDMFAPAARSAGRRALWLGINLATAFIAASVVDLFQTTLDKIVLLAVLMPVVPSMGGIAGTQSLTIMTRAIALGQIDRSNAGGIFKKEIFVGVLNGVLWASVVAVFTYLWFGDWRIGAVIAGAMGMNLVVAAGAGFAVPLALKRIGVDPALAGGVVLTTVTDVVGYMSFLGLGAAFLV
ncbi:MAG: magnesium transporter [Gammaproteobacteria bacterium]|nr:magnesium transporter [Gammaproteobacteria bacterium]MDH4253272.1 magnesium transporter [Gammaproteobacteria bacterium]MDH5308668.1 magnesium transporter [Gammaproteobacteria bacterium]